MKNSSVATIVLCMLSLGVACRSRGDDSVGQDPESEKAAIEALMAKYVSGYESQDVESFVSVFADDAVRMPPNGPVVRGGEAIRNYYQDWFEKESLDVKLEPVEIKVAGDWAYAWGNYVATVTSAETEDSRTDRGKWLNIYSKGADGNWRFHRNIWNSDLPVVSEGESITGK